MTFQRLLVENVETLAKQGVHLCYPMAACANSIRNFCIRSSNWANRPQPAGSHVVPPEIEVQQ